MTALCGIYGSGMPCCSDDHDWEDVLPRGVEHWMSLFLTFCQVLGKNYIHFEIKTINDELRSDHMVCYPLVSHQSPGLIERTTASVNRTLEGTVDQRFQVISVDVCL